MKKHTLNNILFTIKVNPYRQLKGPYFIFLNKNISHLVMVALKIFDVLVQASHVYTVHIQ